MKTGWFAGAVALWGLAAVPQEQGDFLWVEGEKPKSASVFQNVWYDSVDKAQLSGGAWLSHFSNQEGSAAYEFDVPAEKGYVLWIRANPVAAALSFRLNDGPWTKLDFEKAVDRRNIAADDRPDLRFLAWVKAGPVRTRSGSNTLSFRMHSSVSNHAGIDCFVLAPEAHVPKGKLKPGEREVPPDVPALTEETYRRWVEYIRPSADEDRWRKLGWRTDLADAVREAGELQRPVLLWAMNGHPCGHT